MERKYAVITGADHGLGLALTKNLLNRGYYVAATRVNPGETLLDELCKANSDNMSVVTMDIGKDDSVAAAKPVIQSLVPHIDLLLNNAGILGDMNKNLGDDLDFDEMLKVINVNALGPLRVTNALIPLVLASSDKTVLNISSEAGSIGDNFRTGWFGYCMSKSANNMQSSLVHNNIFEKGGQVIVMHPGHVATYMRGHLDTTASLTPEQSAKHILETVLDKPLPREKAPLYIDYKGDSLPW